MDNVPEIKRFLIKEFLPDVTADQLDADLDLLETGVIDSLQLVRVISWLTERFGIPIEQVELAPDNFRSVNTMQKFIESATSGAVSAH
ncbi:phosphopantetheine-binding protein [Streptomyces sp. NPDC056149]|uniref:phosphopantetheine-binding protein n=1 Tax=unclassified Streptomyces TaxID=2593676 RepID=UPI0023811E8B|nr:phosphopantetheine-binding protein [Streptomyces sp. WZ-12]